MSTTVDAAAAENIIPYTDSKFKQQSVAACKPFLTPFIAAIIYAVFSAISLTLGVIYIKASNNIKEYEFRYDDQCQGKAICTLNLSIPEQLTTKVFVYYQLTNFYQNNFMYSNSKVWDQLKGQYLSTTSELDKCDPKITNGTSILVPCGAVANSVFNDDFAFPSWTISRDGISVPSFRALFAKSSDAYVSADRWLLKMNETFPGEQIDERFVNWMQIAAFPKFRKLWGIIQGVEINPGTYSVVISNKFDVTSFAGTKSIVISQVSWIGGKNNFFGVFFLVLCGLSAIAAITFLYLHLTNSLPLYKALVKEQSEIGLTLLK